jgi:hypothetical protein
MQIGILTQPLRTNYGGILQAYALQTVLQRMGDEVCIINRRPSDIPLWKKLAIICKSILLRYILGNKQRPLLPYKKPKQKSIELFIRQYIHQTKPLKSNRILKKEMKKYNFDAYVVGSDQVWRPRYSPCLSNYFVDFDNRINIKKIAYAASFGVDIWEFSEEQTTQCAALIQKFNAVSVREKSGIDLCLRYLKKEAIQLIDPTLLLDKSDYIHLVSEAKEAVSKGNLMIYILDASDKKMNIINSVTEQLSIQPFVASKLSVTQWLRGFMDAKFVVTDSFHGCVFSIIFNKPFLAIANADRGLARFMSLLEMFGLKDRLIYSDNQSITEIIQLPIDWERVNEITEQEKEKSFQYLQCNLK